MVLAMEVERFNSDQCLDYGLIQQMMGWICAVNGDVAQMREHHQKAMTIFEIVFEDEPALLEEKRREIGQDILLGRRNKLSLLL